MIFDLSSPGRKTVIRIVYGTLAFLFLIGFVGFGIGGELGGGGIIDSITGSGGSGSTAEQYEQQIEDAESKLETDPENPGALTTLAQYRYLSGSAQLDQDEATLQPILTEEAQQEFEAAVDAWNRYLETEPRKPNVGTAGQMVQAFVYLGDAESAIEAQKILVDENPSAGTYATLASFYYADFNFKAGDEAAAKAVADARGAERKQLETELERTREFYVKQEKRLDNLPEGATPGGAALDSPFGGLGGGLGAPAPVAP